MKKLLISIFVSLLGAFTVATIGVYCIMSIFTRGKILWDMTLLQTPLYWNLTVLVAVVITACLIYVLVKYKFFTSSKLIRTNDRTISNLYDNQDFMRPDELYSNFGNYEFGELPSVDTSGYVLNSHVVKRKLYVSMIPDQHAMLIGTPGSGKSLYEIGLTIQTNAVCAQKPSMIINDLSGELYQQHSEHLRQQGYAVYVINLRDPRSTIVRYNPLSLVWDYYHQYLKDKSQKELLDQVSANINEIAKTICPDSTGSTDPNWSIGARGILIGCLWGMLEDSEVPEFGITKDMFTITQVSNIVNRQKSSLMDFLFMRNIDSKVYDYAGTIKDNSSGKTVDSYISHLIPSLSLFLEEGIQFVTSATDFDIRSITKQPTAIFVIVPAEFPSRYLIGTMIYTQLFTYLAYEASRKPDCRLDRTIYFLLDEFGNLPKIPEFKVWIATCRKLRIFFFIVLQSIRQLDDVYGEKAAVAIRDCCHVQMYLGANDDSTIEYFQRQFGTYTALQRNQNIDTQNLSITEFKGTTSLAKKDLVTKSDLQTLQPGTMYTHITRQKPLRSSLIIIYDKRIKNIIHIGCQEPPKTNYQYENKIYDVSERTAIFTGVVPQPPKSAPGLSEVDAPDYSNTVGQGTASELDLKIKKNNSVDANLDFLKR